MKLTREQIAEQTSRKLAGASSHIASLRCMIGLDGFVDEIIAVVDKRTGGDGYQPVRTISALAAKIAAASGQSSNYELVVRQMKLGGNGPIMANALAAMGVKVTYVGNLGYPAVHSVFREMTDRLEEVISIGEPAHTDALEFSDGKLMLGKLTPLGDVSWDNLVKRVGQERLSQLIGRSQLIGMVNWTMLPHMSQIWARLAEEVLPHIKRGDRKLFVDLADPEKRLAEDIAGALQLLTRFQGEVDVILGLNLKEAGEIAHVLGMPAPADAEGAVADLARDIRARLGLACVVIHPRRGAAAATESQSAQFAGPFVAQPKISTGAGDHFNAGFCAGQVLGFSLEESLCVGVATSGYYVRTAKSPSAGELAEFIAELPAPQA